MSGFVRSRTGIAKATGPIFIHLALTANQQEGQGEFNEIQEDPQECPSDVQVCVYTLERGGGVRT